MDSIITYMSAAVFMVLFMALIGGPIFLIFWGMYLSFRANVILGIIALFFHPFPMILGILALFGKRDVANQIATWLSLRIE